MKTIEKVRNRIKRLVKRRKKPVIRITRNNPLKGEKLVRVPVPSIYSRGIY